MNIIIKGMEMPKTCGKCKLKSAIDCEKWKHVRSVALDRHRDCPLVPVPPHGRLVDADRIGFKMMDAANADQALAMVDDAPTIIPAEEGET